jgi:glycosyltransferase involved in cell wall biosynthesis
MTRGVTGDVSNINAVRILILTGIFPPRPEWFRGNFVLNQALAFRDLDCDVSVIALQAMAPPRSERRRTTQIDAGAYKALKINVEEVRYFNLPRNALGVMSAPLIYHQVKNRLRAIARRTGADVVHSHNEQIGYVGVRLAHELEIPCGVTLHGINAPWMFNTKAKQQQLGWTLENAGRVFLVGLGLEQHFQSYVRSNVNFRVVPNGVRVPENVVPSQRIPRKRPWRIIGVGNLKEPKGYQFLIRALAEIEEGRPGLMELVIVGGGDYEDKLRKLISNLGLDDIVSLTGELQHSDAMNEIAASDIFCLPSFSEAFGLVYAEAMALGKIAVGCRTQGPEMFIRDGVTGFLVEPRDQASIAKVLLWIVSDVALDEIREAGRSYVQRNLQWAQNAGRVITAYRELMAPRSERHMGYK